MSELKVYVKPIKTNIFGKMIVGQSYYLKSEADKVIARNKYKRCLAMWLYLRECYWRCMHHNEQTRADWYNKWMDKFQKLAEHYKEAK